MKTMITSFILLCLCNGAVYAQDDERAQRRQFFDDLRSCNVAGITADLKNDPSLAHLYDTQGIYDPPLVVAVESDCPAAARLLLRYGAYPNHGNDATGKYPLILAAAKRNTGEIYDWSDFIKDIAPISPVNQKNKYGETALIVAVKKGIVENVQLILDYSNAAFFLNARDDSGLTASMWASKNNDALIANIINAYDRQTGNMQGALAIAGTKENKEMSPLLSKADNALDQSL